MVQAKHFKDFFSSLANSYTDIFFIRGIVAGLLLLAITFLNFNAGISGVLAVLSAYSIALFLGYQTEFLRTGYFTYNALLVGLSIGFLFKISFLSLLIIIIAGGLTLILTLVTANVFYNLFRLQILSIPFVITSTLIYLSASKFTNVYSDSLYDHSFAYNLYDFYALPFWLSGYLKSLGAIIFMPNEITGLLIAILLIISSRILFFLSLSGFILGIILYGLFTNSIESAAQDYSASFNYILIAMALGGVFNIPSLRSYAIAMFGVAIATLISSAASVFWSEYGLPVFTLPFTLITLSFIYALNILQFPLKTLVFTGTPEGNLDYYVANKDRFITATVSLPLPFNGNWHCWQGFDGQWTHKGLYKYAYDFVICDSQNHTYLDQGTRLTDYFCFNKEVISPVSGKIVKIVNHLPDNPIGSTDTTNNWGNEIIIQNELGYYVKIAHFAADSICVFEGQSVVVGTLLGLCGNSGNSPQPHIHIQMQTGILPTAETIPFVFVNYEQHGIYQPSGIPQVNANITHCNTDVYYDKITNFILDDIYIYDVFFQNERTNSLSLKVKMSDLSYYYFESDKGKLYFGKQYGIFYIYNYEGNDPMLNLVYLALSTMPLSYVKKLRWHDSINNALILNSWQKNIASLLNLLYSSWVTTKAEYQYTSETEVCGKIKNAFFDINVNTKIILDPEQKFQEIHVGDYKLIRRTL